MARKVTTTSEDGKRIEEKTVTESNESAFKRELKHFQQ